jgi:CRISPR-associated endonuclease/helicase Cas3
MKWMGRMFEDVIAGSYPRLVDLTTGAGKTELAIIWLLALAWYGKNRCLCQPVPRRLIWIVNRRVLVQQVFAIAEALHKRLMEDNTPEVETVREGLRASSGESREFFNVVELRGQIVADRDWAIRPTVPQLIIGTVDQIGSRLLFQGYGLGKWGRPQQAGLLGVDSWVAVDEAHLVPSFVLTLRQLQERCALPAENLPPPLDTVFARLPFWLTELSATPGLPPPSREGPFTLTDEEKTDPAIADRILASAKRRVQVEWLPKGEKPKEVLIKQLVTAAIDSKVARIAVFVREVGVANAIAAGLKKGGVEEHRICKITGRIRGYERDRLSKQPAFNAFRLERATDAAEGERYFLVGTAAAEVGLDADADVILCDFASLPTLLQRLGRLDRRGVLSRRRADGNGEPPTMRVFAPREGTPPKIQNQLSKLAAALKLDAAPWSAELMAGTHWLAASKGKDEKAAEPNQSSDEAREEKTSKDHTTPLIEAATWSVLNPTDGVCTPPKDWLAHGFARIAAGPVAVPPVTDAVLDYWSATTDARSPHLSPHPFLYGLAKDDEGTPLVGVAFRLEVEALRESISDEDDTEMPDATAEVLEIFKRFPPLRAELHQVSLSTVREWLVSPEAEEQPFVYRDRDQWRAKSAGESAADFAAALGPDGTLVLPASVLKGKPYKKLLEDCEQAGGKDTAISDVFEGVSDAKRARYFRTIEPQDGLSGGEGAALWNLENDENEEPVPPVKANGFQQRLRKELRVGGKAFVFRYFRPADSEGGLQFLDDHDGAPGHLSRARDVAVRLAEAIAPGDRFLRTLLSAAARHHDEGKRVPKWQRAFGAEKASQALAKLHPKLKKPAPLGGFRHEWESLRQLTCNGPTPPADLPPEARVLWRDLFLHLVGVHHGHLRPSIADSGLTPGTEPAKQNPLRLEAAERFARLQRQLGRWRLAYVEALLKTADAEGSRYIPEDEDDGN